MENRKYSCDVVFPAIGNNLENRLFALHIFAFFREGKKP